MNRTKMTKKLCLIATLTLLLGLLFCVAVSAATHSGTCGAQGDNLTWTLDTETGELVIEGTGAMANFASSSSVPWSSYRSSIQTVIIGEGVTNICQYAFYGYSKLTSVTLSDSVTSIGASAFLNCSSLTSIAIPKGVTYIAPSAFHGCSKLTSVTVAANNNVLYSENNYIIEKATKTLVRGSQTGAIPEGITAIGSSAFYGFSELTSVTIPESVTRIDGSAFYGCQKLTSIHIPKSVTSIGESAFGNCQNLTSITIDADNSVYYSENNCIIEKASKKLVFGCKTSVIPKGVTSIGNYAFNGCSGLMSVTIPESVTSIGNSAFNECSDLTSVIIPEGVTSIGRHAFWKSSALESISIPSSVRSIGDDAFAGCSSVTSITVDEGNSVYYSENNCIIEKATKMLVVGCMNSVIPADVTSIGGSAFYNCSNLESVTIPESVTYIDDFAFFGCTKLTSLIIPDSVTGIGNGVFNACKNMVYNTYANGKYLGNASNPYFCLIDTTITSMTSFNLHENTKIIGGGAFLNCSSLESVNIPEGVISICNRAFSGCGNLLSLTLPESVTSIGSSAFSDCQKLESLNIPKNVTSIGDSAFIFCMALSSITVNDNNSVYYSEGNCIIEKASKKLVVGCKNSTIPEDVKSIGDAAFFGCSTLRSITIPKSVTRIGTSAFRACTALKSVTLPMGVTSIDNNAFYSCSSLESVTILSKTVKIGDTGDTISENATIYGYQSSTAREYAEKYDRSFVCIDHSSVIAYNETEHWYVCEVCGEKKDVTAHVYDNTCDTTCNICDHTRVITHTYKTEWMKDGENHWYECSICGRKKDVTTHTWDSGVLGGVDAATSTATKTFTCTACTATKEERVTVYLVTVESKIALTGDTVTVNITFADDTDVKAIGLIDFSYDTSVFELISGEWIGADQALLKDVDLGLNVATVAFGDNTPTSGLMLSLTFKVAEDAPEGEYAIGCTAEVKKMVDGVENTLEAAVIAGNISVHHYARGDVNGDEMVDTNDAIHLLRHVLFPSRFEINQSGDMNADKMVDTNDAIYLLRHVLFPTKFPLY